jgi:hypothetical protein
MFIGTELGHRPLVMRVLWLLLAAMAGLLAYFAMRAYLSPELLIGFANGILC